MVLGDQPRTGEGSRNAVTPYLGGLFSSPMATSKIFHALSHHDRPIKQGFIFYRYIRRPRVITSSFLRHVPQDGSTAHRHLIFK